MAKPAHIEAQSLYERLRAAAWPGSPLNVDENAAMLAIQLLKLGRPTPCYGEPAPESRTFGVVEQKGGAVSDL